MDVDRPFELLAKPVGGPIPEPAPVSQEPAEDDDASS
jgi:hypothetical protein